MFADFYRGKRVLVTGHTGFKGSWLTQWLLDLGAQVSGYALEPPSNPSHFEALGLAKKINHRIGDIRDAGGMTRFFQDAKPEIVFHLAAQAIVRASYDDPKGTFDTNLSGTVNVLEAIRATPSVKVGVLITSDKCYENVEQEHGYHENDRLGGKDPYSASKACAEIAFRSYYLSFFEGKSPTKLATTRAGNVIGGGDWAKDRIVPDCVRAWAKGDAPMIRNPQSTRPWQHVMEPLSGYLWLGAELGAGQAINGEPFNFGPASNENHSVNDLIEEMQKTWPSAKWQKDPAAATDGRKEANLLRLDCEKAAKLLSWEPTMTFPETVKMTAEWYQGYYARKDPSQLTSSQISRYQSLARERKRAWSLK